MYVSHLQANVDDGKCTNNLEQNLKDYTFALALYTFSIIDKGFEIWCTAQWFTHENAKTNMC